MSKPMNIMLPSKVANHTCKQQAKEIKRLHSIIKEVREEIKQYKEIMENGIEQGAYYSYLGSLQQRLDKFLEILDRSK